MLLTFFCVVYLQLSREVLYSILESPLHPYFLFNTVYVITGLYLFRRTIRLFRTMTAVAIANYCVSTELLCLVSSSWSLLAGTVAIPAVAIANYCVSTELLCLVSTSWSLLAGSYTSCNNSQLLCINRAAVPGIHLLFTASR